MRGRMFLTRRSSSTSAAWRELHPIRRSTSGSGLTSRTEAGVW